MRGQGHFQRHRHAVQRITPADAGTSGTVPVTLTVTEDHPRGCGDKWHGTLDTVSRKGSPPRMRGQGSAFVVVTDDLSITPADAGTSEATTGKFDYS